MNINVEIRKVYNFRFYSPGILGIGYDNATVMAIMDYDTAKSISDVTSMHAQAFTGLPENTPRDPKDLTYVKLKLTTNEIRVVALVWISSTPVVINNNYLSVKIYDKSVADIPLLRDVLMQNGFIKFDIVSQ